jgi:hypothetical protein
LQGVADRAERHAHPLRNLDDGDASQHVARVTTLVAGRAPRLDQAPALVERIAETATPLRADSSPTVSSFAITFAGWVVLAPAMLRPQLKLSS